MADNIIRLKVDSVEYDNKLKRASEGLTRYIEGCRKADSSLEVVEKETLQYVRALGQMTTVSRTAKGGLTEMTKAFTDLSMQYRNLTAVEKASPFGREMYRSLGELKGRITDFKSEMDSIQRQVGTVGGSLPISQTVGNISMAMQGVYNGVSTLSNSITQLTQTYAIQEQAELKLQTIMRQRMNATDEDVQSIKDLAAAQQELGVIGDEVQLAGAQQVATFLSSKRSIEALLPAMNNLAVQQNGLNVTSENMVNIGNMVGKVMQGQTGALRRVGITFTEAEEQAMKFGSEEERAAALADVINNNVGQMNQELAKTDAGKAKQLSNSFGDMQENIGKALAKWEPLLRSFSQVGMTVLAVGQIGNAIAGATRAIVSMTGAQAIANVNNRLAVSIVRRLQTTFAKYAFAVNVSTSAVKAATWALRGFEIATSVGLIIAGLSLAFEALGKAMDATGEKADAAADKTKNLTNETKRLADRQKTEQDRVGAATDNLVSKYQTLKAQWEALKTTADKVKWINNNQDAFNQLGMSVGSVNDAYNYFVKNSSAVVNALTAIAEATAYSELYQEDVKALAKAKRNNVPKYAVAKAGQTFSSNAEVEELRNAGVLADTRYFTSRRQGIGRVYDLTAEGARLVNARRAQAAREKYFDTIQPLESNAASSRYQMTAAQERAARARAAANLSEAGSSATISTTKGGERSSSATPKTEEQLNSDAINKLTQEYVSATGTRRAAIRAEIKDLQARNDEIKRLKEEAQGKAAAIVDPDSLKGLNEQLSQLKKQQDDVKTNDAWTKLQKDIDGVQAKIKAITATTKDFSTLSEDNISAFITETKRKIAESDIGSEVYDKLTEKLRNATTLSDIISEALRRGISMADLGDMSGVWKEILAGDDVDAALQSAVDKINEKLASLNLPTLSISSIGGGLEETTKAVTDNMEVVSEAWGNIEGIGSSVESLTDILKGNKNAWESITGAIDAFLNIMRNIKSLTKLIDDLTKGTEAATTATTTNTTATVTNTTAATTNTAAKSGEAIADATAQGAKVPWPGTIAAIASAVAAVVAALALIKGHAQGGFVGGRSFSGDNVLTRLNSGELVLNRAQQGNLAAQLDDAANLRDLRLSAVLDGEDLRLSINTNARRMGYGETTLNSNKSW